MNIKDATSTLLVSAALTGLFAGSVASVRAEEDSTTTVKTEKVEKKSVKKAGKECKKKCEDKNSCKGKDSCKGKAGCNASKEETK